MPSMHLGMIDDLVPPELAYFFMGRSRIVASPNPTDLHPDVALKTVRHYPGLTTQLYRSLQQRFSNLSPPFPTPTLPWKFPNETLCTVSEFDINSWFNSEVTKPVLSLATKLLHAPGPSLTVLYEPSNESPSTLIVEVCQTAPGDPVSVIPVLQIVPFFNSPKSNAHTPPGRHMLGQLQRLIESHNNIAIPDIYHTNHTCPPADRAAPADTGLFDNLILPQYGPPERRHIAKPLRLFLQQLWKEMTLRDLVFAALTEYDSTFFVLRDRREQAFYISDKQGKLDKEPNIYCTMLEITCLAYEDLACRRNLGLNVDTFLVDIDSPLLLRKCVAERGVVPGNEDGCLRHIRLREVVLAGGKRPQPLTLLAPPHEIRLSRSLNLARLRPHVCTALPGSPPLPPGPTGPSRSETTPESSPVHGNLAISSSPRSQPPGPLFETMPSVNSWSTINSDRPTLSEHDNGPKHGSSTGVESQLVLTAIIRDDRATELWRGYLKLNPDCCVEVVAKTGRLDLLEQELEVYRHMDAEQVNGIPSLIGLYEVDTTAEDPCTAYLVLSDEGDSFSESEVIDVDERESFRKILRAIHGAGILHNDLDRSNLLKYQKGGETAFAIKGFHLAELVGHDKAGLEAMELEEEVFWETLNWS